MSVNPTKHILRQTHTFPYLAASQIHGRLSTPPILDNRGSFHIPSYFRSKPIPSFLSSAPFVAQVLDSNHDALQYALPSLRSSRTICGSIRANSFVISFFQVPSCPHHGPKFA